MVQSFWNRWQHEYLTELQHRTKWNKHRPNPELGDVVLIRDDNQPPLRWPMGKIVELHTSNDSIIRVVTLKTSTGIIKRPVVKLCWLSTQPR